MEFTLKVKRLVNHAKLPEKAHLSDLGWDLCCSETIIIPSFDRRLVKTGIAMQFPEFVGGILKDRSSVASKQGLTILAGVIDPNYIGEIMVLLFNTSRSPIEVAIGAKIAQLILMPSFQLASPIEEVTELVATDRGDKGFGSSGG